MPVTLTAQRTAVSVEKLLDVIVRLSARQWADATRRIFVCALRYGASGASQLASAHWPTPRLQSLRRSSTLSTMPPSVTISMMIFPSIMRLPANWQLKT